MTLTDIKGVIRADREGMAPNMARYARATEAVALPDVLDGADIFLGLSAAGVLKPEWLAKLAPKPLILALANPEPEIMPDIARAARPDAIVATGRSDFPNQVNNVLCFPFIFRGALDAGATTINEAMKLAAVEAIAALARSAASETVAAAYGGREPVFGPDYIIPKPFEPRLILEIAPAVARAAMESGVARRPIEDFAAYRGELERFVFRSGQLMRPVFARPARRRSGWCSPRARTSGCCARPIRWSTKGWPNRSCLADTRRSSARCDQTGLTLDLDRGASVLDPAADEAVFAPLIAAYQHLVGRHGVPPAAAAQLLPTNRSVAAAMLLHAGQADAAICGGTGNWWRQMQHILPIIPRRPEVSRVYGLSCLILQFRSRCSSATPHGGRSDRRADRRNDPARRRARCATSASRRKRRCCRIPASAPAIRESARKMRRALALIRTSGRPGFGVDGEMHARRGAGRGDPRPRRMPDSRLHRRRQPAGHALARCRATSPSTC